MNNNKYKYPAYPLITCNPFFSVWSMSDTLYGDQTRHWTGSQHSMTGIITVDGVQKLFMGKLKHNPYYNSCGPKPIEQTGLQVTPLKTKYTFSDGQIELEVCFVTPLILTDLELMSRPVSYISYNIKSLDSKTHNCSVYIDFSSLMAVNKPDEEVLFGRTDRSVWCGRGERNMLEVSGDDHRINWGYLHVSSLDGELGVTKDSMKHKAYKKDVLTDSNIPYGFIKVSDDFPAIFYKNTCQIGEKPFASFICVAYDDIHSLIYFGKEVDAYYRKSSSFTDILNNSLDSYEEIMKKTDIFEKDLLEKANRISSDYAKLVSIAYRQSVAAHKLAWTGDEGIFVSKECFSNGCAATVDVTYPSVPLFLIYNPTLVEYMLNPIFKMIELGKWNFDFAPHDAGQYPLLNGQVYGLAANELQKRLQMPIEECGNIILCIAALCRASGNTAYAQKHFNILKQWADYLVQFGFDPENQLCTDDFAGHLAHNCNLSVKAIMGIAAWGMILDMSGNKDEAAEYISKAREFAKKWKKEAADGDHYRLAFDKPDSWSIKYNLVWDKLFGLNIFDEDIFVSEISYYMKKINQYGLPLDNRSDYTKSDWQMWSTVLSDNNEYRDKIVSSMLKMLSDTNDKVPFTDWYYTTRAVQEGFQNRTVQGGLFINMLKF